MRRVEDVDVGGSELPEDARDARGLVQMAGRIVDLDQFQSGLNAELFLLQLRERLFQIGLRIGDLAKPLFRNAEQRPNLPQVGTKFDCAAKFRGGLRVVVLEKIRYTQIAVRIDIVRIQRQDRAELTYRQIGLTVPQELLCLPRMRFALLLFAGEGLG